MQLKPAVMRPRPLPAAHTAAASVAIVALAACHFERAATVLAPPAPNQPPVADPGGPYTGGDTAAISFDGTRSFDPDSDMPLAYAWDFGDGNAATGATPAHAYVAAGVYTVTLTVTDARGARSAPVITAALVTAAAHAVLLAAGDIASCGVDSDELTARILDTIPSTVLTLGDNAFPDGTLSTYVSCYDPTWGRHKARTYATLGNHEYKTGTAAGSFDYFGDRAGPRDQGYYSFDLGAWHIIVLNSNGSFVPSAPAQSRTSGSKPTSPRAPGRAPSRPGIIRCSSRRARPGTHPRPPSGRSGAGSTPRGRTSC
ncbi:MAG TPA: PKD domain-containing protein [Gemmatimonadales bacterium]|nr:PKD domain-containing protein [Gemmatimonadales bacterium]